MLLIDQIKDLYFVPLLLQKRPHGFQQLPRGIRNDHGAVGLQDIGFNETVAFARTGTADTHHIAVPPRLATVHGQIDPVCHNHIIGSGSQNRLAAEKSGNCGYGVHKVPVKESVFLWLRQGCHGCAGFAKALQVFVPFGRSAFHALTEILFSGIG